MVCFQGLFQPFDIESVDELILGANKKLADAKRLTWNVQGIGTTNGGKFIIKSDYTMAAKSNEGREKVLI